MHSPKTTGLASVVALTTGDVMKTCFTKLTLIAGLAMLASPSFAQLAAQSVDSTTAMAQKVSASPPKSQLLTTNMTTNLASKVTSTAKAAMLAASSALLLADGIVGNAAIGEIHSPAPGFVYER
jgi:hypothetical protein